MSDSRKLLFENKQDGRFEIQAGSHLFLKEGDAEGIYWEWQKIPAAHVALREMLSEAEENLNRIKRLLPDLPKNEIK